MGAVQPGEPITHYEYEQDGSGTWISTGGTATSHTVTGLNNGQSYTFLVRAVNALGNGAVVTLEATPSPSTGGGGGGGPQETVPSAPRNLLADAGDGAVTLTWDAPEDDGDSEITDYQYRINGRNPWTAIGSTDTTHTVTGLVNGTVYVFEVRAANRIGRGRASNRAEATPMAPVALDFAHFANGTGITSEMVLVNVASQRSGWPGQEPAHPSGMSSSRPAARREESARRTMTSRPADATIGQDSTAACAP